MVTGHLILHDFPLWALQDKTVPSLTSFTVPFGRGFGGTCFLPPFREVLVELERPAAAPWAAAAGLEPDAPP